MQRNTYRPPVQVGEEFDVRIEAVGEKGDGVARVKGFVLFVPNTKQGENCRIRVTKVLSKLGFAEKVGESSAGADKESETETEEEPEAMEESEDLSEDFGEDLEEY